MKRFIPIKQVIFKPRGFATWLDKLTFLHIFVLWLCAIIVFGLMYFAFAGDTSYLYNNINKAKVTTASDSIYFSFVSATTTGFGDVIPIGFFKLIAVTQVIFGLLLLAFVTSKLVSIKQDVILGELYDISFNEQINKLRSSLMVFRQNLARIAGRIEENSIRKRELGDVYIYFSNFEDSLQQIEELVEPSQRNHFKKVLDSLDAEIIFNSVVQSFEKISEFIGEANKGKAEWKRDITTSLLQKCMALSDTLFVKIRLTKILSEKLVNDLATQNKALHEKIKAGLAP